MPNTCRLGWNKNYMLSEISVKVLRSGRKLVGPAETDIVLDLFTNSGNLVEIMIPKNFLSVLHPNLVSSPIKGILEILNLTPRCIPTDILAWTDCVRPSAGKIS